MVKKPISNTGWLLRLYWQYLKPYDSRLITVVIGLGFTSWVTAYLPVLNGRMFDLAISGAAWQVILRVALFWLALSVLDAVVDFFSSLGVGYTAVEAGNQFEFDLANHAIALPVSFHRDKKISRLTNRINQAVRGFSRLIQIFGSNVVSQLSMVVFALYYALRLDWRVGGLIGLCVLLYALGNLMGAKVVVNNVRKYNQVSDRYGGQMFEAIINVETVKAHSQEDYERKRLRTLMRGMLQNYSKRISRTWRELELFQNSLFALGYIVIFFLALYLVHQGEISAGQIVTVVGYLGVVFRPFGRLADLSTQIREHRVALERIRELWETPTEFVKDGTIKEGIIRGEIEFRDVVFRYQQKREVLKGVNFTVQPGEVVALVGESGVGKTTIADLLARFFEPTKGQIRLDGVNLKQYQKQFLRSRVATVPQSIVLFNDTVMNNIRYGRKTATRQEAMEAARLAFADQFIQTFPKQYDQLVGERGVKLSGGQRQRIAIARALLRDPRILILDEATASLDAQAEQYVHTALQTLIKGRTTFIIAHRLSTIKQANKILVLHQGQIAESGTHEQLMAQGGIYQNLYALQVENF